MTPTVLVTGAFDDLRSRHVRFLEVASKLGPLTVGVWTDELVQRQTGSLPKFPFHERVYLLEAMRYVERVVPEPELNQVQALALEPSRPMIRAVPPWEVEEAQSSDRLDRALECRVLSAADLQGFGAANLQLPAPEPGPKRVIVTGCYDWLHSGHVRFFEEASGYGELFVVVGHDVNIRSLKGEGHPLLGQNERRYMVGAIRFVTQALIASGNGWVDAEPEINRIRPDIYAVNEDGDKGGKREFCEQRGIEYLVLKRTPAPGLSQRSSTALRGF